MFKTTDKITKAIDFIRKATVELENEERKQQAISCVHQLTVLYSDCFKDMTADEVDHN